MPEVNVEINGRKYRMACEEGQEAHLQSLADVFNSKIDALKGSFGEIGDSRLTVMAGIAALDELQEAQQEIAKLQAGRRRSDPCRPGNGRRNRRDRAEVRAANVRRSAQA